MPRDESKKDVVGKRATKAEVSTGQNKEEGRQGREKTITKKRDTYPG